MSLALTELRRSLAFRVDHPRFAADRVYVALALADTGPHEDAEYVFINELGETIFVPIQQCLAAEPNALSQSWPSPYRGRRDQ